MWENILYKVTVIDTIGLFNVGIGGDSVLTFKKIKEYFIGHFNGINLILFVCKKGRFNVEQEVVFSFIMSKFSAEISHISALAVTYCENYTAERRSQIAQEFLTDEATRTVASRMEMGIYISCGLPAYAITLTCPPITLPITDVGRS